MKSMKKFKSGLIGLGLVIPVASVAGVVASCGKKETPSAPKTTFDAFTKAAEAETPVNIVMNAKPKAKGWVNLPKNDLTKVDTQVSGQTIVIRITSNSKTEIAVFSATYVDKTAYNVNVWTCSEQPVKPSSWIDFKTAAEKGGPQAVLADIQAANPAGINIDFKSIEAKSLVIDASSKFSDDGKNVKLALVFSSVPTTVGFTLATKTINLTIAFKNVVYDAANWTAPDYTFADFTEEATASVLTDSWKTYAKKNISDADKKTWENADCEFGTIAADPSTKTLTLKITNKANSELAIATLKFHSVNNKVWIYGEQMGEAKSGGAWSFGAPVTISWVQYKDAATKWANGQQQAGALTIIDVLNNLNSDPAFPTVWKDYLPGGTTDGSFTAKERKPNDETKHIIYYEVSLDQITDPTVFTLYVDVTQKGNDPLGLDNFSISSDTPKGVSDWGRFIEQDLINDNTDSKANQSIVTLIDEQVTAGDQFINMETFLNTYDDKSKLWVKIDATSYKYDDAGGPNKCGIVTFKMAFWFGQNGEQALTTGGLFSVYRNTQNSDHDKDIATNVAIVTDIDKQAQ